MIKYLIKLANELDKRGLSKEADYIDAVLKKISSDEDLDESRVRQLVESAVEGGYSGGGVSEVGLAEGLGGLGGEV